MKTQTLSALAAVAILGSAQAQNSQNYQYPRPAPTPYVYEQKQYGRPPVILDPMEAQAIVDDFRSNYTALGSPRILIYVNRDLVDGQSGLKLSARSEKVETTSTSTSSASPGATNAPGSNETVTTHTVANNTYADNGKAAPSLADRQTVRDVERLIGRPLRAAGATLVDQAVAEQLAGDRPLDSAALRSGQSRDDVSRIADVVLEVLISSRTVTVPEVSGDKTYTMPDLQVTAIRLKDAKVIGQATAADVINKAGGPGVVARNFGVSDITEATSLALMDNILHEGK